jgi:RNA polymerase sigma-54 factor
MSAMSSRLVQSVELRQELRINPRLYQAMELLYMPLLDLQQHLKAELAENPFLEMSEADVAGEVRLEEERPEPRSEDEIDWEGILLDGFEPDGARRSTFEERESLLPVATQDASLQDRLLEQLHHLTVSERETRLGEEIIGNL